MSENSTTLTGVLVDVSGSMKSNVGEGVKEEGGEWVRSIFQVIDDLVKYDISETNEVFAIGFGAKNSRNEIFDILGTLKKFQSTESRNQDGPSFEKTINSILQILQYAGATSVRKWANIDVIKTTISHNMATVILNELKSNGDFLRFFVDQCLPPACKSFVPSVFRRYNLFQGLQSLIDATESIASTIRPSTKDEILEVIGNAMDFFLNDVSISASIFRVQEASKIIRGCVGEEELTKERLQELLKIVRPIIYGGTPFYESLRKAKELFSDTSYNNHKKMLFVLSDGSPTDKRRIFEKFLDEKVMVVSCYITASKTVEPHKLYSDTESAWEDGAKLMFELSSKVPTQLLPRTILIKHGWKIDITNNETKMFLQVNNPDIMKDACHLARTAVCCQDALANILVLVSLDIYINQSNGGFGAPLQNGGTCYANASAVVLHLSMKRIIGREGGYPDFETLRQDLIRTDDKKVYNILAILQKECRKHRLHCQKVNKIGAIRAITAKRLLIAIFYLTVDEWTAFSNFFREHKTGILTRKEIDVRKPRSGLKEGHAVVLTSFNSECLYFMNSWGTEWGDNGFFRVKNADVLDFEFFDVFWKEEDLTENEKDYYKRHGSEVADKLMKSLISLQVAKYQCPICNQESLVTDFTGHLSAVKCPKCNQIFSGKGEGNILALNMYLTSLSK